MSSLEGPVGETARAASYPTQPLRLIDRVDGVGWPTRLQSGHLCLLEVKRPRVDPVSSDRP